MYYDIIAIHVDYNAGTPIELRVAILSSEVNNYWKAYKSNSKPTAGYPIHDIEKLNDETIQRVAASGIKCSKKEALKYFPGLSKIKCENE